MADLRRFDNDARRRHGVTWIGGIDEAGRGALAGPVVAGVVVLGPEPVLPGVADSKTLKPEEREALVPRIIAEARGAAIGLATAAEVDEINVLNATLLAAQRALDSLARPPEFLITDYLRLKKAPCPQLSIAKGDSTSLCVAAASILAKVARDRIMTLLDREYPQYGFARHKAYGTAQHLGALEQHGPSTVHRLSFRGVCWFTAEPTVRSRSASGGTVAMKPDSADLLDLLVGEQALQHAGPFLPECETGNRLSAATR